jgi:hypothetical protein
VTWEKVFDQIERTQEFNDHLMRVPAKWRRPIVDVVDTFFAVRVGLKSIGIDDSSVLTEAVRMVLERSDRKASAEDDE